MHGLNAHVNKDYDYLSRVLLISACLPVDYCSSPVIFKVAFSGLAQLDYLRPTRPRPRTRPRALEIGLEVRPTSTPNIAALCVITDLPHDLASCEYNSR